MDGRNPAPPKDPWNDDSLVDANQQWFAMVSKWCRILSIHSMNQSSKLVAVGRLADCLSEAERDPAARCLLPCGDLARPRG